MQSVSVTDISLTLMDILRSLLQLCVFYTRLNITF